MRKKGAAACGHTQCAAIGPNLLSERHSGAVTMPKGHKPRGRGNGQNEPLHQARELRMEARAEAEAGAASLEPFALLVLCSHCAAIALVICSSRDFNALTRSSTSRLRDKGGRWRWRLRLTKWSDNPDERDGVERKSNLAQAKAVAALSPAPSPAWASAAFSHWRSHHVAGSR